MTRPDIFDPVTYRAVRRPPLQAEPLPAWCYTSSEFLRREADEVFAKSWVCIGRGDLIPDPGDYRAFELCGWQLVMLRDRAGKIRVLSNVCRHRGAVLLEGTGHRSMISCPFHAWGYALDGSLRAAPDMEETQGFDKANYRLTSYEVAESCGFVFVRLMTGGPSLADSLGDLETVLRPWQPERLKTARERHFVAPCNWKLFLEVFMEDYHLKAVHKSSIAGTYTKPEHQTHFRGDFATIWNPHPGTSALLPSEQNRALPAIEGNDQAGTRYAWFYPSFAFAATLDCLWYFEVYPDGPARTRVTMGMCFPPESIAKPDFESTLDSYAARWKIAMDEDLVVLDRQQRGLESGQYIPGRLSHLEPVVGLFANWLVAHAVERPGSDTGAALDARA